MVVSQDDARAVALGCISDDLTQRERGAAFVAVVARYMQATGLLIDMGDPQAFARRIGLGQTTGKEVTSGTEAVQFQREFGTLITHCDDVRAARDGGGIELGPKAEIIVKTDLSRRLLE